MTRCCSLRLKTYSSSCAPVRVCACWCLCACSCVCFVGPISAALAVEYALGPPNGLGGVAFLAQKCNTSQGFYYFSEEKPARSDSPCVVEPCVLVAFFPRGFSRLLFIWMRHVSFHKVRAMCSLQGISPGGRLPSLFGSSGGRTPATTRLC